ncbi:MULTISPECIES: SpaH/EbpB family LPXTG-anchored major pilin [unclassified Ruminococcus]|uniref:SpaH/EbpB family LPXTG-anchored major pilin n=1 Tax=unclassified Ruminococcus TaxID=2608920 RepID=UPI00210E08E8|nr:MULTISPECIES: SpaH/EbpB family LPXTG-anchored major pilin [unclassified Ruminococcus]MCQ4021704.1 SpaH/EbpB family LPXTG-anchored major pilin [Ruminococcus sp. zg-924]MCQ4114149.1 SpaH/EbpB family LPXTG-anchored major pilin [Ruminococcus sp. zg-921]
MKKFAAIFISMLLVGAMMFSTVASAASVLDPTKTTGTLTLTKYESDSDKSKAVTGAEFTAYQVAQLTSDGTFKALDAYKDVSVTVGETAWTLDKLMQQDDYSTDKTTGGLTFTSTDIFEKMIPALQAVAQNETAPQTGLTSTENPAGTYTFGDMPIGVYLVAETKVPKGYTVVSQSFLVSIPEWDETTKTWNYDITASPKDAPVSPDKAIVGPTAEGETNPTLLDEDTVAIGDNVPYQVTANLPFYGDSLPTSWTEATVLYPTQEKFDTTVAGIKYALTDTMSKGLTFNNDLAVVIDNGGTPVTLTKDTDYTLTTTTDASDNTVITVDFKWANINQYQGKKIKFTYSATVNEDAVVGPNGNKNSVKITYDNDPQVESDDVDTEPDETTVYTYGMDLTKTFNGAAADGTDIDASGVEFSLSNGGEKLWFITSESGKYIAYDAKMTDNPATADDESTEPAEGTKVTIDGVKYTITQALNPTKTGSLAVDGLDVGTYTLVEENSIEGFSKLASDVTIVVSEEKTDGKITGKVIATVGDTTLNVSETNLGKFLFTVNNVSKQFDLPLTGGTGLLLFTIGGGIVMAVAIIIFSQLRKKKATDK